ncbi:MAG: prolyl oligopeptidase family serine peptidase [Candidatus Latescibacteria bacterium]|nr:prolyl oligopeptidase family serine peptidase [Candidatus Latescibacterota bacterium]MDP7449199.1 prolyl oligopeptidase family serine peptidase [Candidatus Latescibacterota bacterium]HJP33237.1 prolyl oligopeptidase family serine peptidase [Candidatus Latescibacterota bacterium]
MSHNGYGHMVLDDVVTRVREMREDRRQRLAAIRTRKQALAYQQRLRRAIRRACGPRPPKTPLKARITGVIEHRQYRVEKILYESRPGCLVSAHLYVPKKLDGPAPAVLGTCGHSAAGKLEPLYQGFCQRLVRSGFVVLIIDPFNQGERDQYHRLDDRSAVANCCHAHNMMGKQLELLGDWFGMWRAWDGIRGLDYLLSRTEVDRTRVGLTGNSGGGTMTTWLWAMEPRFTMAAPSCFVTTFLANLENEIPADCEQYPPGVLGAGLEMADFIIAGAPKPVLLLGQQYCFFDRRGLQEAYDEVRHFYDVLRAPEDSTGLFIGPDTHGFHLPNQEAMVDFFSAQAGTTATRLRRIDELGEEGNVTERGNTVAAGAIPIYELIGTRADELRQARTRLSRGALVESVRQMLHLPARVGVPHCRVLRGRSIEGYRVGRYAVETARNVRALLHKRMTEPAHIHTLDVERQISLFLPHVASDEELAQAGPAVSLAKDPGPVYLLDPRGMGESRPDETGDFFHPYGMDYMFHGHELLFGGSYLGQRVYDVLRVLDLLVTGGARRIDLSGRGQGALLAAYAALLHDHVTSVTLYNAPLSYEAMTQEPLVAWPVASFPRGVLAHFDLPDVYRALGRRLRFVQPWDERMRPLSGARLKRALAQAGLPEKLLL